MPLTERLRQGEQRLTSTEVMLHGNRPDALGVSPEHISIEGPRNNQIKGLRRLPGLDHRLGSVFVLRDDIRQFLGKVREDEQPFSRVYQMSRQGDPKPVDGAFTFNPSVLQTRHRLLTESLLLRCDYAILSDFLHIVRKASHRKLAFPWLGRKISLSLDHSGCPLTIDFSFLSRSYLSLLLRWLRSDFITHLQMTSTNTDFELLVDRSDCMLLAQDADRRQQPMTQVEALVQFAKFVALERMMPQDATKSQALLVEGRRHLDVARDMTVKYPSTAKMVDEIEEVETMLCESTFYTVVTSAERQAVYMAMAQDFQGTGHWYYCVNMHPVSCLTAFKLAKK